MTTEFTKKLDFVLKALSLSRGRLAADLGVNKSVVSRWLSGAALPTSHNLARVTALIARAAPDFTMLDWDLPLEVLAARLAPAPRDDPDRPLAFPLIERSTAEIAASGDRYTGLWRSTRVGVMRPEMFARDHLLILRAKGQLTIRLFSGSYDWPGWAVLVRGRINILFGEDDLSHIMLAPPDSPIVEAMDGLMLASAADNFRSPVALPLFLERVSPPGLVDPQDPVLEDMIEAARGQAIYVPESDIDPALVAHLRMEVGYGRPGGAVMRMDEKRSQGRGRWF